MGSANICGMNDDAWLGTNPLMEQRGLLVKDTHSPSFLACGEGFESFPT